MPAYTRGQTRPDLKFVLVNPLMAFGFKPKDIAGIAGVTAADVEPLGHTAPDTVGAGIIKVIGANTPKPPRVTKKLNSASIDLQGSVSTFCAYNALSAAGSLGWSMTKGRMSVGLRAPGQAAGGSQIRTVTAIANLSDGSKYVFPMNKADFTAYGETLGLVSAATITTEAERNALVSGSSIPKPGRANRRFDNGSVFASFFSTSVMGDIVQAGFDILSEERVYV